MISMNTLPLIVGRVIPFTGSSDECGPFFHHVMTVASWHANAASGVNDGSVVYIRLDSTTNPEDSQQAAVRLIDDPGAIADVGAVSRGT